MRILLLTVSLGGGIVLVTSGSWSGYGLLALAGAISWRVWRDR